MLYTANDTLTANSDKTKYDKVKIKDGVLLFDNDTTELQFVSLTGKEAIREIRFTVSQPGLKYLNVSRCNVEKIYFSNNCCPQLRSLYLHHNKLAAIEFNTQFPQLQLLDLSFNENLREIIINNASSILPELKYLYLHKCKLGNLQAFAWFFINDGNDFNVEENEELRVPPVELVSKDKDKVRNWFRQQRKYGKQKFYEAKILIVGEGVAGKTSLMEKLFDESYPVPNKEEKSTLGIEVRPNKKFPHPSEKNIDINTSIWDFGGQDIQYFLHHFFLSEDALYILVSDPRSDNKKFSYWFQIINFLGGKEPNLVVVYNIKKDTSSTIKYADISQFESNYSHFNIKVKELDLSKVKPNGKYKTWEDLKEIIAEKLSLLPTVGQDGIGAWEAVRKKIVEFKDTEKRPYIFTEDFDKIAIDQGMDEQDIPDMLYYFSKIGLVVYFKDDLTLNKYVFLDPNWITKAIYAPLSNENIEAESGTFTQNWIFGFWKHQPNQSKGEKCYTEEEKSMLLSLMQKDKFDICYPLGKGKYVVPFLLPIKKPTFEWEGKNNIQLKFEYKTYIPEGVISQFIVRMNEDIAKDDKNHQLVWKTGVVLENNNAKAVVEMHTNNKDISIRVDGTGKTDLRGEVINVFNKIFERYPKQPEKKVPCYCLECAELQNDGKEPYFFNYEQLINAMEKGDMVDKCQESRERVSIPALLEGIDLKSEKRNKPEGGIVIEGDVFNPVFGPVDQQKIKQQIAKQENSEGAKITQTKKVTKTTEKDTKIEEPKKLQWWKIALFFFVLILCTGLYWLFTPYVNDFNWWAIFGGIIIAVIGGYKGLLAIFKDAK